MQVKTKICIHCGCIVNVGVEKCLVCSGTEFIDILPEALKKERRILFLTGPTGSGKNYIAGKLEDFGHINLPSVTTRQPRPTEVPGKDYIFITDEEFSSLENSSYLCEKIVFGSKKYGISKIILLEYLFSKDSDLIIIVEPSGLIQMLSWFNLNNKFLIHLNLSISSVLLDIPRLDRFINLLEEENILIDYKMNLDNPEIEQKLAKILDRFVRNGDNIVGEYLETLALYSGILEELKEKQPLYFITMDSRVKINMFLKFYRKDQK